MVLDVRDGMDFKYPSINFLSIHISEPRREKPNQRHK